MNMNKLPVEIMDKELPYDNKHKYKEFSSGTDENTSGGFANFIFLVSVLAVGFLWGMLVIILS